MRARLIIASMFSSFVLLIIVTHANAESYSFQTLVSFDNATVDGYSPTGPLTFDSDGNMWGVTTYGGVNGGGTIFEITADTHTFITQFDFGPASTSNACYSPAGRLVLDSHGNIFGQTGSFSNVVFKYSTTSHQLTVLSHVAGGPSYAGLVTDSQGNLFGITSIPPFGAPNQFSTVFEIPANSQQITTLATFQSDISPLVTDSVGNIFGVTGAGGTSNVGSIFEITAGTHNVITLASFDGSNGAYPGGGLAIDSLGNIFGVTTNGGASNYGTVFKLDAGSHVITALASFDGSNGQRASGQVAIDSDGNLYGTTLGDYVTNSGNVFKFDHTTETIIPLATFPFQSHYWANDGVVLDANGNIYGTDISSGSFRGGSVFELLRSVPEPSSVIHLLALSLFLPVLFRSKTLRMFNRRSH
ncbi:hypothetical protein K2Y11_22450 [bacterium]|nr:hypothetical protein [bacterium]